MHEGHSFNPLSAGVAKLGDQVNTLIHRKWDFFILEAISGRDFNNGNIAARSGYCGGHRPILVRDGIQVHLNRDMDFPDLSGFLEFEWQIR